jgi:hypothetical protein
METSAFADLHLHADIWMRRSLDDPPISPRHQALRRVSTLFRLFASVTASPRGIAADGRCIGVGQRLKLADTFEGTDPGEGRVWLACNSFHT